MSDNDDSRAIRFIHDSGSNTSKSIAYKSVSPKSVTPHLFSASADGRMVVTTEEIETLRLLKAFSKIKNSEKRRELIDLIRDHAQDFRPPTVRHPDEQEDPFR